METKHTSGPWFVNPLGLAAQKLVVGTDATFVANCGVGDGSPNEKAANARLIAAAPELLAALQKIHENVSEGWIRKYTSEAIEAATGIKLAR